MAGSSWLPGSLAALSQTITEKAAAIAKSIEDELTDGNAGTSAAGQVRALLNPLDDEAITPRKPPKKTLMLPWEQPGLSDATRARMRALSSERAIFLAPPAAGRATFSFDMEASLPLVLEALAVDKRLEQQRGRLVPQQVSEATFFTN